MKIEIDPLAVDVKFVDLTDGACCYFLPVTRGSPLCMKIKSMHNGTIGYANLETGTVSFRGFNRATRVKPVAAKGVSDI